MHEMSPQHYGSVREGQRVALLLKLAPPLWLTFTRAVLGFHLTSRHENWSFS
jgi:hypothetical protein